MNFGTQVLVMFLSDFAKSQGGSPMKNEEKVTFKIALVLISFRLCCPRCASLNLNCGLTSKDEAMIPR